MSLSELEMTDPDSQLRSVKTDTISSLQIDRRVKTRMYSSQFTLNDQVLAAVNRLETIYSTDNIVNIEVDICVGICDLEKPIDDRFICQLGDIASDNPWLFRMINYDGFVDRDIMTTMTEDAIEPDKQYMIKHTNKTDDKLNFAEKYDTKKTPAGRKLRITESQFNCPNDNKLEKLIKVDFHSNSISGYTQTCDSSKNEMEKDNKEVQCKYINRMESVFLDVDFQDEMSPLNIDERKPNQETNRDNDDGQIQEINIGSNEKENSIVFSEGNLEELAPNMPIDFVDSRYSSSDKEDNNGIVIDLVDFPYPAPNVNLNDFDIEVEKSISNDIIDKSAADKDNIFKELEQPKIIESDINDENFIHLNEDLFFDIKDELYSGDCHDMIIDKENQCDGFEILDNLTPDTNSNVYPEIQNKVPVHTITTNQTANIFFQISEDVHFDKDIDSTDHITDLDDYPRIDDWFSSRIAEEEKRDEKNEVISPDDLLCQENLVMEIDSKTSADTFEPGANLRIQEYVYTPDDNELGPTLKKQSLDSSTEDDYEFVPVAVRILDYESLSKQNSISYLPTKTNHGTANSSKLRLITSDNYTEMVGIDRPNMEVIDNLEKNGNKKESRPMSPFQSELRNETNEGDPDVMFSHFESSLPADDVYPADDYSINQSIQCQPKDIFDEPKKTSEWSDFVMDEGNHSNPPIESEYDFTKPTTFEYKDLIKTPIESNSNNFEKFNEERKRRLSEVAPKVLSPQESSSRSESLSSDSSSTSDGTHSRDDHLEAYPEFKNLDPKFALLPSNIAIEKAPSSHGSSSQSESISDDSSSTSDDDDTHSGSKNLDTYPEFRNHHPKFVDSLPNIEIPTDRSSRGGSARSESISSDTYADEEDKHLIDDTMETRPEFKNHDPKGVYLPPNTADEEEEPSREDILATYPEFKNHDPKLVDLPSNIEIPNDHSSRGSSARSESISSDTFGTSDEEDKHLRDDTMETYPEFKNHDPKLVYLPPNIDDLPTDDSVDSEVSVSNGKEEVTSSIQESSKKFDDFIREHERRKSLQNNDEEIDPPNRQKSQNQNILRHGDSIEDIEKMLLRQQPEFNSLKDTANKDRCGESTNDLYPEYEVDLTNEDDVSDNRDDITSDGESHSLNIFIDRNEKLKYPKKVHTIQALHKFDPYQRNTSSGSATLSSSSEEDAPERKLVDQNESKIAQEIANKNSNNNENEPSRPSSASSFTVSSSFDESTYDKLKRSEKQQMEGNNPILIPSSDRNITSPVISDNELSHSDENPTDDLIIVEDVQNEKEEIITSDRISRSSSASSDTISTSTDGSENKLVTQKGKVSQNSSRDHLSSIKNILDSPKSQSISVDSTDGSYDSSSSSNDESEDIKNQHSKKGPKSKETGVVAKQRAHSTHSSSPDDETNKSMDGTNKNQNRYFRKQEKRTFSSDSTSTDSDSEEHFYVERPRQNSGSKKILPYQKFHPASSETISSSSDDEVQNRNYKSIDHLEKFDDAVKINTIHDQIQRINELNLLQIREISDNERSKNGETIDTNQQSKNQLEANLQTHPKEITSSSETISSSSENLDVAPAKDAVVDHLEESQILHKINVIQCKRAPDDRSEQFSDDSASKIHSRSGSEYGGLKTHSDKIDEKENTVPELAYGERNGTGHFSDGSDASSDKSMSSTSAYYVVINKEKEEVDSDRDNKCLTMPLQSPQKDLFIKAKSKSLDGPFMAASFTNLSNADSTFDVREESHHEFTETWSKQSLADNRNKNPRSKLEKKFLKNLSSIPNKRGIRSIATTPRPFPSYLSPINAFPHVPSDEEFGSDDSMYSVYNSDDNVRDIGSQPQTVQELIKDLKRNQLPKARLPMRQTNPKAPELSSCLDMDYGAKEDLVDWPGNPVIRRVSSTSLTTDSSYLDRPTLSEKHSTLNLARLESLSSNTDTEVVVESKQPKEECGRSISEHSGSSFSLSTSGSSESEADDRRDTNVKPREEEIHSSEGNNENPRKPVSESSESYSVGTTTDDESSSK